MFSLNSEIICCIFFCLSISQSLCHTHNSFSRVVCDPVGGTLNTRQRGKTQNHSQKLHMTLNSTGHLYIYIYISLAAVYLVARTDFPLSLSLSLTHTHTHTNRRYHPSPPPPSHIPCLYWAIVDKFLLVVQHFHVLEKGSVGEPRFWTRPCSSRSIKHVLFV